MTIRIDFNKIEAGQPNWLSQVGTASRESDRAAARAAMIQAARERSDARIKEEIAARQAERIAKRESAGE